VQQTQFIKANVRYSRFCNVARIDHITIRSVIAHTWT